MLVVFLAVYCEALTFSLVLQPQLRDTFPYIIYSEDPSLLGSTVGFDASEALVIKGASSSSASRAFTAAYNIFGRDQFRVDAADLDKNLSKKLQRYVPYPLFTDLSTDPLVGLFKEQWSSAEVHIMNSGVGMCSGIERVIAVNSVATVVAGAAATLSQRLPSAAGAVAVDVVEATCKPNNSITMASFGLTMSTVQRSKQCRLM